MIHAREQRPWPLLRGGSETGVSKKTYFSFVISHFSFVIGDAMNRIGFTVEVG